MTPGEKKESEKGISSVRFGSVDVMPWHFGLRENSSMQRIVFQAVSHLVDIQKATRSDNRFFGLLFHSLLSPNIVASDCRD